LFQAVAAHQAGVVATGEDQTVMPRGQASRSDLSKNGSLTEPVRIFVC
jgi:hypothetical protein